MLTELEQEALLKLSKEPFENYNPNTLAKQVGKTRVGLFKALRNMEKSGLVIGETLGKARFYHPNYEDEYAMKTIELLLMEQSQKYIRWKEEFKGLTEKTRIIILFGSITRNEQQAKDIDLLLVYDEKNNTEINALIKEKNDILTKKIHPLKQTHLDFRDNLMKKDKVILGALKEGIVLHGYGQLMEMIKNVAGKK